MRAAEEYLIDGRTLAAINALRPTFGVKTAAGVIRKALALARVCAAHANPIDHSVTIVRPSDGQHLRVMLDESRRHLRLVYSRDDD